MAKQLLIDRDFCLQKLTSTIELADNLTKGDYPHSDSKFAIERIKQVFQDERTFLSSKLEAKEDTNLEFCRRANIVICRLKPFMGLVLRSSNLRNAFETYFPIKTY